jgi:hypothetical protein
MAHADLIGASLDTVITYGACPDGPLPPLV